MSAAPASRPGPTTASPVDDTALSSASAKVARRLVPFLILLYFINYLDRTNIGFAGPGGMNKDLGLSATQFGLASGLFFIGYLVLEVPSNMALHRFGARRWIARIMVTWGIVATLMSFVPNGPWLYVSRFALGIAEAGFFPGIILYLTYWFPERTRARMTSLFMLAIPLSSIIGAPLSSWILANLNNLHGLAAWRVMFLYEGIPAIIVGIICWWYLTDRPAAAKWLSPEERTALSSVIEADESAKASRYAHVSVRDALTKPRVWALSFVYFGVVYGLYSLSFFLPTIIGGFQKQYGVTYDIMQKGLITAVPYVFGAAAMFFWSRHGDKAQERVRHYAIPTIVGGIAVPISLYLANPLLAMVGVTVCCMGICAALPTFWPLATTFLSGAAAASGIALINSVGNLGGFIGPYITGWLSDRTGTDKAGMWAIGICMVAAAIVALTLKAAPRPVDETVAPPVGDPTA